jgi:sec-independent protein translocase protein TatA
MPFGGVELIILLVIILLFFGARRIPELAKSLGVGARELKKAVAEDDDENKAKEPDRVEAREAGEKTITTQQEDAPLEEQNPKTEPTPKA